MYENDAFTSLLVLIQLTLEGISIKKITRMHKGMGGGIIGSLLSNFDTIHSIDFIFDTNNKRLLYIQISET